MKKNKIFIQIASYRDPELAHTIESLIENADNPENLVICIAWQNNKEDKFNSEINKYFDEKRCTIKIIDIDYKDSKGACWARYEIQRRYDNEEYTLQLDSHHRFVKGWDTLTKKMYNDLIMLGIKKPLLTAYLPSYNPQNDPNDRVNEPWKMVFDRFTPEGVIFFLPVTIENWNTLLIPIRTRFYSAHFAFTTGKFCLEVPHNPEYYFHGEEISIAVRAFTHGYDLFHPHKIVAWHEYTREGRKKHWDENKTWQSYNSNSLKINRELFGMDGLEIKDFGKFGFGKTRLLEDYEKYAGIKFNNRGVQKYTLDRFDPPNPEYKNEEEYLNSFETVFKHCINVYKDLINQNVKYDFIAIILEHEIDGETTTIFRKDLLKDEFLNIFQKQKTSNNNFYDIWVEFTTKIKPNKYVVWPYKTDEGWGDKIEGTIGEI